MQAGSRKPQDTLQLHRLTNYKALLYDLFTSPYHVRSGMKVGAETRKQSVPPPRASDPMHRCVGAHVKQQSSDIRRQMGRQLQAWCVLRVRVTHSRLWCGVLRVLRVRSAWRTLAFLLSPL
mmetsp:Transcript_3414/g.7427  ORF Transcript_3414/g.7427 Transcript_3414/m.7427 type:complete len:121 (+) Transcript_3414:142-504(+)